MEKPHILYDTEAKPKGVAFDQVVQFYNQTNILVYNSSTGNTPIVIEDIDDHKVILQDTKISTDMKTYLGVKKIKAGLPITRKEYYEYRGWEVPENENPDDMVYLVEYEPEPGKPSNHPLHKGYISMSPKDVFEKAYRETGALTFGLAIEALRKGMCVARKGWNGKGMFITKQVPGSIGLDIVPKMASLNARTKELLLEAGNPINYQSQMLIIKPDGTADSWVPSSSDVFAEDWYEVNV